MVKYRYTESAKKTRYCDFCNKKLGLYEAIICEFCLKKAIAILEVKK